MKKLFKNKHLNFFDRDENHNISSKINLSNEQKGIISKIATIIKLTIKIFVIFMAIMLSLLNQQTVQLNYNIFSAFSNPEQSTANVANAVDLEQNTADQNENRNPVKPKLETLQKQSYNLPLYLLALICLTVGAVASFVQTSMYHLNKKRKMKKQFQQKIRELHKLQNKS